ncbi:MAG TPA: hypothetical protein VFE61_19405 [Candidatus Sulfotelmatobacter sp.]|jgi:hypothetical protein|nr:hypothetical protein [Candidatus Sulfotelmatobacter sp.]
MKPAFVWRLIAAVALFVVLVALTFGPMHAIGTLVWTVPLVLISSLILWAVRKASHSPR